MANDLQQSEELDKFLPALCNAQAEFPEFYKNTTGQYKYLNLCDLMGIIRPILCKHGLVVYHKEYSLDNGERVLGTIVSHAASQQFIETRSWLKVESGGRGSAMQQYGSAMSYIRRYSIMSLLGIAPGDDIDDNDGNPAPYRQEKEYKFQGTILATEKQRDLLKRLLSDKKIKASDFYKQHNIEQAEDLTKDKASFMIKELQGGYGFKSIFTKRELD